MVVDQSTSTQIPEDTQVEDNNDNNSTTTPEIVTDMSTSTPTLPESTSTTTDQDITQ